MAEIAPPYSAVFRVRMVRVICALPPLTVIPPARLSAMMLSEMEAHASSTTIPVPLWSATRLSVRESCPLAKYAPVSFPEITLEETSAHVLAYESPVAARPYRPSRIEHSSISTAPLRILTPDPGTPLTEMPESRAGQAS
jgi:hypothetical protein